MRAFIRSPLLLVFLTTSVSAQIRITSQESLALEKTRQWMLPKFSPNGQSIFFTTVELDGIWEYSIVRRTTRQITSDAKSGGAFVISPDAHQIAYRRNIYAPGDRIRRQEVVIQDLADGASRVLAAGRSVGAPSFVDSQVVYSIGGANYGIQPAPQTPRVAVLGIEDTKIALSVSGRRTLLDPMTGGRYIWPSLSPDGRSIVAYEMAKGTFTCTTDGSHLVLLGKRDAPVWTRSGKWIIYMDDRDDGDRLLSSDLRAVSADGRQTVQLTFTDDIFEMNPQCSPTEDKIVCDSEGVIYVLTYEEAGK